MKRVLVCWILNGNVMADVCELVCEEDNLPEDPGELTEWAQEQGAVTLWVNDYGFVNVEARNILSVEEI